MPAGFKRAGSPVALVLALLALATTAAPAQAASNACRRSISEIGSLDTPAVELPGTIESSIAGAYAVIRRSQSASDLLPPVNTAGDTVMGALSGYYAGEIRRLAALPDGASFFLVPGLPRLLALPPLACVPKPLRKRLATLREAERKRASEPAYCVVSTGLPGDLFSGGAGCGSFGEVAASKRLFSLDFRATPIAMLVPDGVAAVRVTGPGATTVTLPVAENAYVYQPPPAVAALRTRLFDKVSSINTPKHATKAQRRRIARREFALVEELVRRTEPAKVQWLTAAGAVTNTVSRPRSRGLFGALIGGITTG